MLTHGSLFAGIGGFDLGFERAGISTKWQVEIDPFCRRVLARHFQDAARFADIRECCGIDCLDPGRWRGGEPPCKRKHHLRPVDILSGGFPCQDISNAGKRAGIDGDRSGLWSEYARLIRELRPRYAVVENVAALLHRGIERVLGDLAAIGYDAEWQSIRASDVGAPHRRERIWIVAYPECGRRRKSTRTFDSAQKSLHSTERAESSSVVGPSRENVADAESERRNFRRLSVRPGGPHEATADAEGSGEICDSAESRFSNGPIFAMGEPGTHSKLERSDWWAVEPDVGRVAHGISARVDRLRGLGNAIVPQIAEAIGRWIRAHAESEAKANE